jgi:hypothetical protein
VCRQSSIFNPWSCVSHTGTKLTKVEHRCDEIQEDTAEQEDQTEVTSTAHKGKFYCIHIQIYFWGYYGTVVITPSLPPHLCALLVHAL